jgi:hypothetical protein
MEIQAWRPKRSELEPDYLLTKGNAKRGELDLAQNLLRSDGIEC